MKTVCKVSENKKKNAKVIWRTIYWEHGNNTNNSNAKGDCYICS